MIVIRIYLTYTVILINYYRLLLIREFIDLIINLSK